MLISSLEELRLYDPSSAIDRIETMAGFFDSSEQDFLAEKLGAPLHEALSTYYATLRNSDDGISTFLHQIAGGAPLPPYARLLKLAQSAIVFDALSRAIDMQAVSINGAGINIATADDYQKADREAVADYKERCACEAHAAVNRLLRVLETWEQESDTDEEKAEIALLWRESRFYYLSAKLLLPSASVLMEYLDFYGSREKFIAFLPDIRHIQEDIISPVVGEDFVDFLTDFAQGYHREGMSDAELRLLTYILHRLRKAAAFFLEERTKVIRKDADRRLAAHNEAAAIMSGLTDYIAAHAAGLPAAALPAFQTSPLYAEPETESASTPEAADDAKPLFENNAPSSVIFVTPSLD